MNYMIMTSYATFLYIALVLWYTGITEGRVLNRPVILAATTWKTDRTIRNSGTYSRSTSRGIMNIYIQYNYREI